MAKEKGISLIALIVTIIVIIILSGTIIRVSTDQVDNTNDTKIANEMRELETAALKRYADYSINSKSFPLIGSEVSVGEINGIIGISIENIDYIRRVDKADLQALGLRNTTGSTYIVDYITGDVFKPIE